MYIPYFALGCNLEINAQRTSAYLANVSTICGDGEFRGAQSLKCDCPPLYWAIPDEPDGEIVAATYVSPSADQAPWLDSDIPESTEFLGFLVHQVTMNSVTSRSVTTRVSSSGGGVIGPIRSKERRLDFEVLLFACNELAMEYGYRYLADSLGSTGCDDTCTTCDAEYRDSCPPLNGTPDFDDLNKGRWILKNAAAVSGPDWMDPPVEGMACNVRMVKFSIVSEFPWKYKCPVTVCDELPLAEFEGWDVDCDNAEEFFCQQQYAYCSVEESLIVGETALIISVTAGSVPLQHIDIAITPDKFGYECNPEDRPVGYVLAEPCDRIQIPWIPASSTIVYDTSTESITLYPAGGGSLDGTPFVSTEVGRPPTFPTLRCGTFCIRVGVSECSVQDEAVMTVQTVHREV